MAMDGDILGTAVGNALFAAIPAEVLANMSATQCTEMCNQLMASWKLISKCFISHIQACAVVTVAAGISVEAGSCTGSTVSTGTGTIS